MSARRLYTQEDCDRIQQFINSPNCRSNTDVSRHFKIKTNKLKELHSQGLIKLKATLSKTMVARMGNAANKMKQSLKREVAHG